MAANIKAPSTNMVFWVFVLSIAAFTLYNKNKTVRDLADSTIGAVVDLVNGLISGVTPRA